MIGLKPPSECNPEADDNSDNEYHQSYSINIEEAKTGTSIGFFSCLISSSLSLFLLYIPSSHTFFIFSYSLQGCHFFSCHLVCIHRCCMHCNVFLLMLSSEV